VKNSNTSVVPLNTRMLAVRMSVLAVVTEAPDADRMLTVAFDGPAATEEF
jgi:hypothetical protein